MNAQQLKDCPKSFVATQKCIHHDKKIDFYFAFHAGVIVVRQVLTINLFLVNEWSNSQKNRILHQTMLYWTSIYKLRCTLIKVGMM